MNMGPRAAPTLEASQSRAGRAPGPIQEASRPAGCPACLASPQPAAAGPPLASSPQPVGSGGGLHDVPSLRSGPDKVQSRPAAGSIWLIALRRPKSTFIVKWESPGCC